MRILLAFIVVIKMRKLPARLFDRPPGNVDRLLLICVGNSAKSEGVQGNMAQYSL
jgi:hypothetical protein